MATYEITAEMNLKKFIDEAREVAQAFYELADNLERIEKEYAEPQGSEKIDCGKSKCENCKNHNYCDYDEEVNATDREIMERMLDISTYDDMTNCDVLQNSTTD